MNEFPMRLQVFMAHSGLASRRTCESYIQDGLVTVNGKAVLRLGTKVEEHDVVAFRERTLRLERRLHYVALHKPRGYISASSDPQGRPVAVSFLARRYQERLYNVGRLDYLSSGLLLFTNDGDFARLVSHPSSCIEKEYLVESDLPVSAETLTEFKRGVVVAGEAYRISGYTIRAEREVLIRLVEGKNREIRNLFASRDFGVKRIHRVRIGTVTLGTLPPGESRELTKTEISWFRKRNDRRH